MSIGVSLHNLVHQIIFQKNKNQRTLLSCCGSMASSHVEVVENERLERKHLPSMQSLLRSDIINEIPTQSIVSWCWLRCQSPGAFLTMYTRSWRVYELRLNRVPLYINNLILNQSPKSKFWFHILAGGVHMVNGKLQSLCIW